MTTRDIVDSPTIRIALYALALGIAWASLEAKVATKAEKSTVEALEAKQNATYSLVLDMRCEQHPNDRRCR